MIRPNVQGVARRFGSRTRRAWVAGWTVLGLLLVSIPAYGDAVGERSRVSPRTSLFMSTAVPGWGQLANGHRVKGAVLFAGGAGLVARYLIEDRRADRALERANRSTTNPEYLEYYGQYSTHFDRKQDAVWWAVFLWLYAMVDAYVDAHLRGFDERFEGEPEGDRLRPWGQMTEAGFRIGIRIGA